MVMVVVVAFSEESPWILQQYEVCFAAKDDKPGMFRLNQNGAVYALKLVYRSGYVGCSHMGTASHWGCNNSESQKSVGVLVTDDKNEIIFPKTEINSGGFYRIPGYTLNSTFVAFTDLSSPMYGSKGQELYLWYGEDYMDLTEEDNVGTTCADV